MIKSLRATSGLVLLFAGSVCGVTAGQTVDAPSAEETTSAPEQRLTYQMVRKFMKDYDLAMESRNPDAVMRFFAERINLAVKDSPSQGGNVTRYNRSSFAETLVQVLPRVDSIDIERSRELIKVLPGGQQAEHRSHLTEKARVGTEVMEERSEELTTIALIGGMPKIVSIQAVSKD